jgi:LysR family glycine cleavage system transcriptional activator
MLRHLPPLNAFKAFEAAARSESLTRAAEELCVTQGAVSQQVKALEATLGIRLFFRERQRLVITEAGREYLRWFVMRWIELRWARSVSYSVRPPGF